MRGVGNTPDSWMAIMDKASLQLTAGFVLDFVPNQSTADLL
jgi:hypothetical protein